MRRSVIQVLVFLAAGSSILAFPQWAGAASHPEITPVPLGQLTLEKPPATTQGATPKTRVYSFPVPRDVNGTLGQPLLLIAAQPQVPVPGVVVEAGKEAPTAPAAATLKFRVGEKSLPEWKLEQKPTLYALSLATLRTAANYARGWVDVEVELESVGDAINVTVLGMPDLLMTGDGVDGPVRDVADKCKDADVQSYLSTMQIEAAGELEKARAEYQKLAVAKNAEVARFARRSLRMLAFRLRKPRLSGNFMWHYRWGLYLRQCGLFGPASNEFDECRILDPNDAEAQLLAGDMFDRMGRPGYRVINFFLKAGALNKIEKPTDWYALVIVLKSIKYTDENGQERVRKLTDTEILDVKGAWLFVEQLVYGASNGRIRIITSFYDLADDSTRPFSFRAGGMLAPPDDIVEKRGWFDTVVSVRPRTPADVGVPNRTVGGDLGPNGAALTDLFHDTHWRGFFEAWYRQFQWAAAAGEIAPGFPMPPMPGEMDGYGFAPVWTSFHSGLVAMQYLMGAEVPIRPKMVIDPAKDAHVALWRIDGSFAGKLLDPIPAADATAIEFVQENDFTDLTKVFPDAKAPRTRATTWVYSPQDQQVRAWLGRAGPLAMTVNGRRIYESKLPMGGKYENRNVPDAVAASISLSKGWNEIQLICEAANAGKNWGYSLRLAQWDNTSVPGLACVHCLPEKDLAPPYLPPPAGEFYNWQHVRGDFANRLPRLTEADLRKFSGIDGLTLMGNITGGSGFFAVSGTNGPAVRQPPSTWQNDKDRDVVLNNLMDWEREACAAIRYQKNNEPRDLLFVKPEALPAYLTLTAESPAAAQGFGNKPLGERLLGYVSIPAGAGTRNVFVLNAVLGDNKGWPTDEEDLLVQPAHP